MKSTILRLLRNGYVKTSKYSVDDLAKWFYPIKEIAYFDGLTGVIRCNGNPFWKPENNDNRMRLYHDLARSTKSIKGNRYHVLVEITHGDRYGIVA